MSVSEKELQEKAVAPRVTLKEVEDSIVSEYYFTAADGVNSRYLDRLPNKDASLNNYMICVLVLKNGFVVKGESACADSKNFDAVTGQRLAREKAVNEIWPLLGYELKTKLMNGEVK